MASKKQSTQATMTEEEMQLWEDQIIFYQTHLDIAAEDLCKPLRLTDVQHVMVRAIGNTSDIKIVCSRGLPLLVLVNRGRQQ